MPKCGKLQRYAAKARLSGDCARAFKRECATTRARTAGEIWQAYGQANGGATKDMRTYVCVLHAPDVQCAAQSAARRRLLPFPRQDGAQVHLQRVSTLPLCAELLLRLARVIQRLLERAAQLSCGGACAT